jgi:hypothetical protein
MSDLDAAIKEHLALKRLHGADPAEVARLEEEALGTVSRQTAREFAEAEAPYVRLTERPVDPQPEPVHLEVVPGTSEHALSYGGASDEDEDAVEATQEYSVGDQGGWIGSPVWQGGAA